LHPLTTVSPWAYTKGGGILLVVRLVVTVRWLLTVGRAGSD